MTDSKAVAEQIDSLLKTSTGYSPNVASAWNTKITKIKSLKAALVLSVQQQIAQQQKKKATNQG